MPLIMPSRTFLRLPKIHQWYCIAVPALQREGRRTILNKVMFLSMSQKFTISTNGNTTPVALSVYVRVLQAVLDMKDVLFHKHGPSLLVSACFVCSNRFYYVQVRVKELSTAVFMTIKGTGGRYADRKHGHTFRL